MLRLLTVSSNTLSLSSVVELPPGGFLYVGSVHSQNPHLAVEDCDEYHAVLHSNFNDSDGAIDCCGYFVTDCGSQKGTFVNGKRISLAGNASLPVHLQHGSFLRLGSTKFQVHFYSNDSESVDFCNATEECVERFSDFRYHVVDACGLVKDCDWVEPVIQEAILNSVKRLKVKRHLKKAAIACGNSVDRYHKRVTRMAHTTQMADAVVQVKSSEREIDKSNIGFRMLQRQGWTTGEGVGKTAGAISPLRIVQPGQRRLGVGKQSTVC